MRLSLLWGTEKSVFGVRNL